MADKIGDKDTTLSGGELTLVDDSAVEFDANSPGDVHTHSHVALQGFSKIPSMLGR